ncbi:hypothetical protein PMKS-000264 [Pichia membranifaciens]|uniref:Uncharacterized protein n=1 Tax=Pichia membranifaciens TaxID=4926 RepID=A0A1Q2YBE3_9ASCO|nr:hypothetical protein PMKS-000264 [Pichia membranifaciens]
MDLHNDVMPEGPEERPRCTTETPLDDADSACDTQADEAPQNPPVRVTGCRADDGVRTMARAADRAVVG